MKLIVGLGNPGKKFKNNRHNTGFVVIDALKEKKLPKDVVVRKTNTFMNSSGLAVSRLVKQFKIQIPDLWVVHDDLDIVLGDYKIQQGKGPKVHRGVASVEKKLGQTDFWRVRIGVENRDPSNKISGEKYVLQDFDKQELVVLDTVIDRVVRDLQERLGPSRTTSDFSPVGDILKKYEVEEDKYITREFQQYGYDLAEELDDLDHKSLYIKLAKETPRNLLEAARSFVKDAEKVDNKGALFMWRLQQLKKNAKMKQ